MHIFGVVWSNPVRIHLNSHKIRSKFKIVNFVRNSYKLRTNFVPICPTLHSFTFLLSFHRLSLFDNVGNAFAAGVRAVQS